MKNRKLTKKQASLMQYALVHSTVGWKRDKKHPNSAKAVGWMNKLLSKVATIQGVPKDLTGNYSRTDVKLKKEVK